MIHELLYIEWDVSPYIFEFGGFGLRWYSLMFVFAFMFGMFIYKKMLIRDRKPLSLLENILIPVFLGTFLGARLGHYLFYQPDYFITHFWSIFIPVENGKFVGFQGLASHGAAIGILLGLYYYSRKNRLPYLWVLDRIVITIALAGFFIRMGNLMNSEIIGHTTDMPWGFVFVRDTDYRDMLPRHPSQIYEALSYLAIFVILYLLYLKKRRPFRDGVIFSLFLILLFGSRFFIEFFKEVQVAFEQNLLLDMGQWLSIPLIVAGFVILILLYRKGLTVEPQPEPEPVPAETKPVKPGQKPASGRAAHKSGTGHKRK